MNNHTLQVLEFDRLREFLASFAVSEGGRRLCLSLQPACALSEVRNLLDETTEMRAEIDLNGALPLSGIHAIEDFVARARVQNAFLDAKTLIMLCETIEAAALLKKYFAPSIETTPHLYRITDAVLPLTHIAERIRKCVNAQGEVLDSASDFLSDIRSNISTLRKSIIKILEGLLDDDQKAYAIQDDFITVRNNRYVIPVRSDSKTAVPGVVHDQSQSKATFFIEPLHIIGMNNELQVLRRDEYYEELRILTELTALVAADADAIIQNCRIAETVDLIHARALFSKALDASPAQINTDRAIALMQCRHPMLLARFIAPEVNAVADKPSANRGYWMFDRPGVVPIDIVKKKDVSTLVITGANAGGKTVAMKTLGLFVLMTQSGMHIPAASSSNLPFFDSVYADIGDEQNIEANVSTFTSHISSIKEIVLRANNASLILLDELGSGTDPSEGGALAVAILDFLRRKGCCTVITTHLNVLKTYAYGHEDVENVSVAFDPESYRPLYTLVYGVPGFSNALAIARTIGMPDEILSTAQTSLSGSDRHIAELIHGLEKTHRDVLSQNSALRKILDAAARYEAMIERLVDTVKHKRDILLRSFETASKKLLRESENELTKIIREQKRRKLIRPDEDFVSPQSAKEAMQEIRRTLYDHFAPPPSAPPQPVEQLSPGQSVYLRHLKKQGTVTAADNTARIAEVSVGAVRVKAGFHDISLPQSTERTTPQPRTAVHHPAVSEPSRINVIGMRVSEALPLVDKTIDNALLQGGSLVEIIHGRGTGRLMQAIHEHLKNHECVCRYESASSSAGGTGVTIAYIK